MISLCQAYEDLRFQMHWNHHEKFIPHTQMDDQMTVIQGKSGRSHAVCRYSEEPLAFRMLQQHFSSFSLLPGSSWEWPTPFTSAYPLSRKIQDQPRDRCLSFQLLFLEAHCLGVTSIYWLFILLSASGMLIKSVDLNNCFPSAISQKVSWCILYPEGKWKLCVLLGNCFLCWCSFFSMWMCGEGDCLLSRGSGGGRYEGRCGGRWEISNFPLPSVISFKQILWFYIKQSSLHNQIDCLSQIFSWIECFLRWASLMMERM